MVCFIHGAKIPERRDGFHAEESSPALVDNCVQQPKYEFVTEIDDSVFEIKKCSQKLDLKVNEIANYLLEEWGGVITIFRGDLSPPNLYFVFIKRDTYMKQTDFPLIEDFKPAISPSQLIILFVILTAKLQIIINKKYIYWGRQVCSGGRSPRNTVKVCKRWNWSLDQDMDCSIIVNNFLCRSLLFVCFIDKDNILNINVNLLS